MTAPTVTDRRVSLALLFAIAVQTAGALLWTGAAAQRIEGLERRAGQTGDMLERLARLEEQIAAARLQLHRLEDRLTDSRER